MTTDTAKQQDDIPRTVAAGRWRLWLARHALVTVPDCCCAPAGLRIRTQLFGLVVTTPCRMPLLDGSRIGFASCSLVVPITHARSGSRAVRPLLPDSGCFNCLRPVRFAPCPVVGSPCDSRSVAGFRFTFYMMHITCYNTHAYAPLPRALQRSQLFLYYFGCSHAPPRALRTTVRLVMHCGGVAIPFACCYRGWLLPHYLRFGFRYHPLPFGLTPPPDYSHRSLEFPQRYGYVYGYSPHSGYRCYPVAFLVGWTRVTFPFIDASIRCCYGACDSS